MLQIHLSYETHQRAVEIFSKCVCFLGTSISKISVSDSWERPGPPLPLPLLKSEQTLRNRRHLRLSRNQRGARGSASLLPFSVSRFQTFLTSGVNVRLSRPRNTTWMTWVCTEAPQRCASAEERRAALPRRPDISSVQASAAGKHPRMEPRHESPRLTRIPASGRPSAGRGRGLRPARRWWGGSSRGRRRAFPARSPASCVLWSRPSPLPCWIVRPPPPPPPRKEGWRRSWEFSAVSGVRRQRASGQSLAPPELGASLSQRGPPSTPPSRGLLPAPAELRDAAPLITLLPPLSPRKGTSARPLAGGDGPGLPTPPAKP